MLYVNCVDKVSALCRKYPEYVKSYQLKSMNKQTPYFRAFVAVLTDGSTLFDTLPDLTKNARKPPKLTFFTVWLLLCSLSLSAQHSLQQAIHTSMKML